MLKKSAPRYILLGICAILLWQISSENIFGVKNRIVEASGAREHQPTSFELQIMQKINKERTVQNLPPLTIDARLIEVARQKSADMIKRDYFSHQNPEGEFVWKLLLKNGYRYQSAGENLARNFSSAEDIVSAWMKSNSHRKNVLSRNFSEIGVGIEKDAQGRFYITAIFGKEKLSLLGG